MTNAFRLAVLPASPGAAAALCAALLLALPGCGPEPAEINRSPVAGTAGENPDAADVEDGAADGARNGGTLTLTGGVSYDGPAAAECGPAAPRTGDRPEGEEGAIGRVDPEAGDGPVAEEPEAGHHGDADARFDVTLTAAGAAGLAVTLHLPPEGTVVRVPVLVAALAADGTYRESAGTAEVHLERGSQLTRSAATEHLSGRFTGSYRGEAGDGELSGRFTRCFYFD